MPHLIIIKGSECGRVSLTQANLSAAAFPGAHFLMILQYYDFNYRICLKRCTEVDRYIVLLCNYVTADDFFARHVFLAADFFREKVWLGG